MSYLVIEDVRGGLDARKFRLAAPAGTLTDAVNGHVTPGAEFEKRKAFVPVDNPSLATTLPAGTFGIQETASGIVVFGSADLAASDYPDGFSYQRLQHPARLAGEDYNADNHAMDAVIWSEVFGGLAFVVARFADGNSYCYYNGDIVDDFIAGLVLAYMAGDNVKVATAMKNLVDELPNYSCAQLGPFTTTHRSHDGLTATLTIGAHTLQIGEKIWVTGIATTGYNVSSVAITATTATTISYATGTTLTEGVPTPIADVTGTVKSAVIDIDGDLGADYVASADIDSTAGAITGPTNTVSPVSPVTGVGAVGSFTVTGGSADGVTPVASTATIDRAAHANATDGQYFQIGKKKYTFRTSPSVEGDVKIGADAAASLTNLQRAITHEGTPGTDYICSWAHPWIRTATIATTVLTLTAYHGSQGKSIGLIQSGIAWTLSGSGYFSSAGAGNCVSSVKVVSTAGVETEILNGAVAFTINAAATAAAVRDNIAAYSGTSGYTAEVNGNTVTIVSSAAASPMPNGYFVQVACGGNVLTGECLFYLTQQAASAISINTLLVDGLDCIAGAEAFPQTGSTGIAVDTIPEYYAELVYVINSRSGITGINAWTEGSYIKLSRITTRNDDQPLPVYITPSAAPSWGVVFDTPPAIALPLAVVIPDYLTFPNTDGKALSGSITPDGLLKCVLTSAVFEPIKITGGNGLFSYLWRQDIEVESPVSHITLLTSNNSTSEERSSLLGVVIFEATPSSSRAVNLTVKTKVNTGTVSNGYPLVFKSQDVTSTGIFRSYWRLTVTDSFGNKATSNACLVEFQII